MLIRTAPRQLGPTPLLSAASARSRAALHTSRRTVALSHLQRDLHRDYQCQSYQLPQSAARAAAPEEALLSSSSALSLHVPAPPSVPCAAAKTTSGDARGAIHHTRLCRAPRFPASAPLLDSQRSDDLSSPLARELQQLSRDDFGRRVFRFSRLNFAIQDRPAVHTYLVVLLHHRIPTATPKQMQDYIQLAHVAGFHALCVELFDVRQRAEAAGQVALATAEEKMIPSESVIDSAYALHDTRRLSQLATLAAQSLESEEAATTGALSASRDARDGDDVDDVGSTTTTASSARALQSSFALVRCLWRVVCLHSYFEELAAMADRSTAAAQQVEADQAAHAAIDIYTHLIQPVWARAQSTSHAEEEDQALHHNTNPHQDAAQESTEHTRASSSASTDGSGVDSSVAAWEPTRLLRRLGRIVRYDASGDDGEMLFHQFCLSQGWLRMPGLAGPTTPASTASTQTVSAFVSLNMATSSRSDSTSSSSMRVDHMRAARELFYSLLIATCSAGSHVNAALAYYDMATDSDLSSAGSREACEDVLVPSASSTPTSPAFITDQVPWRLIIVLQTTRDNRLVVRLVRRLLAQRCPLGISVWSLILISAGEARAGDVALHAYQLARHHLQLDGSGGRVDAAVGGVGVEGSQHGWEYLLQTSISALSKCQVRDFEQQYLAPCVNAGLLRCTDDFYYGCLLQDAHNALDPAERAETVLARMERRGVPLSAVLISRLLKLYLRVESPAFLPIYRHAVEELGFYRSAWRDELLLWADRRRYMLTAEERAYVLDQIAQHTQAPVRDHLGGLRTQYALLEYDARVQPLETFARTHAPPAEAPTILDSRMHFVLKKPHLVQQGIQHSGPTAAKPQVPSATAITSFGEAAVGTAPQKSDASRLVAAPLHLARAAEAVVLTRESPLRSAVYTSGHAPPSTVSSPASSQDLVDNAYRLYLGDLVEGLQRTNNRMP